MDKLIRKLTNKVTGLPIVGAIVKARPRDVGAAGDVDLVETPAGSGIYASASEIAHNTYGIIVGGQDSLDEATVEPGRVGVKKSDGSKTYPLIDRVVDARVVLGSFLTDSDFSPTSTTLITAIAAATGSNPRTLVLDSDVSLTSAVSVTGGDLVLDLNGFTLTLANSSASITSGTRRIRVFNGKIHLFTNSCKIKGDGTNFSMVQFSGVSTSFAQMDGDMTFDGCDGLSNLVGAQGTSPIASVGSGSHGFGIASQLRLTDPGSSTGNGRLVKMQAYLDTWHDKLIGYIDTAAAWLDSGRRDILQAYISAPLEMRNAIARGGAVTSARVEKAIVSVVTTNAERMVGLKLGVLAKYSTIYAAEVNGTLSIYGAMRAVISVSDIVCTISSSDLINSNSDDCFNELIGNITMTRSFVKVTDANGAIVKFGTLGITIVASGGGFIISLSGNWGQTIPTNGSTVYITFEIVNNLYSNYYEAVSR